MERVKKEGDKQMEQLVKTSLNDENLIKAINRKVIPVAGYVMNACRMRKGQIDKSDKVVKTILRKEGSIVNKEVMRGCMEKGETEEED